MRHHHCADHAPHTMPDAFYGSVSRKLELSTNLHPEQPMQYAYSRRFLKLMDGYVLIIYTAEKFLAYFNPQKNFLCFVLVEALKWTDPLS
jgi:hypothetical protein